MKSREHQILTRIQEALAIASKAAQGYVGAKAGVLRKSGGDPVTDADRAVNTILQRVLPRDNEGWFSEETVDDHSRLQTRHVWIVDPLDGTKEFIAGIPEWSISIGYVEDGRPVAGGVCNPATDETFVGAVGAGMFYNGQRKQVSARSRLNGATVLASRTEFLRGEWDSFIHSPFSVHPIGSVAYKLALVAAGKADATWTLTPKNEWDVAAGVSLVLAAGGIAYLPHGGVPTFNNENPLLSGLIAHSRSLSSAIGSCLGVQSYDE